MQGSQYASQESPEPFVFPLIRNLRVTSKFCTQCPDQTSFIIFINLTTFMFLIKNNTGRNQAEPIFLETHVILRVVAVVKCSSTNMKINKTLGGKKTGGMACAFLGGSTLGRSMENSGQDSRLKPWCIYRQG